MKKSYQEPAKLAMRAAMMLALMVLTTMTAWAFKTEAPVTYTVSCNISDNTITIMNGSTTTASWTATTSGVERHWVTNDIHNLSNGMTIKPSADIHVQSGSPTTKTSTTFTFTAPSNIAITGVTFKKGSTVVDATSSEPGTTFTVTLASGETFTGFVVTYGYISGTCEGSITTWSLDKENGQYTALTIGGSGEMSGSNAPWGTDLTSATVGSGFTAIGNNAFNGYTALKRVNIQKTDGLVTLSSSAFNGCNALQYIVAPTPALAVEYKSAANWSAHAEKMRADFGGYAFRIDYTTTADAAYAVADDDDLRHLAAAVNAGNNGSSLTFRQTDDITFTGGSNTESNYTAIGSQYRAFCGTFNGQGHVVRGIRIYQGDNNPDVDDYQGLFGNIGSGAKVENIILADAHITGFNLTGGIAGYNSGTIENCHVLSNVTVHAVQSTCYHHGGIVGGNRLGGTVTGCTSAAAVTTADNLTNCHNYGGIVGLNGATVKDCIYLGTTVEGNESVGAIVGYNSSKVQNCYFTDTNICGKDGSGDALSNANSAVGYNSSGTLENCGLALQDAADNSGFISLMAARNTALTAVSRTPALSTAADITLSGRTLYKDGKWNTLCLPFNIADINAKDASDNYICPLHGATVKTLVSSSFSGGTLSMNFTEDADNLTAIEAGKPYIVKWTPVEGYVNDDEHNIVSPVFAGVTVSNASANVETEYVNFVGSYSPVNIAGEDRSILFLGGASTLYYPNAAKTIGAFRAYFQLNKGLTAGDPAAVKEFKLNFWDSEENTTGVIEVNEVNASLEFNDNSWYDLQGRRLGGKPTQSGLYIYNGKKVLLK